MGKRRTGREFALKMLYGQDLAQINPQVFVDVFISDFWTHLKIDEEIDGEDFQENAQEETEEIEVEVKEHANRLFLGVVEHLEDIDLQIESCAKNWKISRMGIVDRNVLRMSVYELMHEALTPSKVILNEAIEIAKSYGSSESFSFVNGILDELLKTLRKDHD